ncbi:PH domain-containing protein [Saccharomonospora piscinae]|uniref:PH domain-containing protein n=1 Tax=Saccharomonospora piscinae TaxID=687388 RepID=UPI0011064025|nr:PH domain-containing protein [Saccharomonospora piscinae]TLW90395.1 PH domain-containing protein [Saccharomonospora piscinae]
MTQGETRGLRLRAPEHQIDRRARLWWWTQWALCLVPLLVALGVLTSLIEPARTGLAIALAAVAAVGVPTAVLLPLWWYHVHRWEITDEAVYTRTGLLWQEWRIAPMSRIQTVDTQRGPLERLFGLATVTVTTASAKGAVTIPGLDHARAAEVVDQLTRTTQATPGDAT